MFADKANNLDGGTWLIKLSRPDKDNDKDTKRHKFMENQDNWRIIDRSIAIIFVVASADKKGNATAGRDNLEFVPESKVNNDPEKTKILHICVRSS